MAKADYKQYNRERDSGRGDSIEDILVNRIAGIEVLDIMLGDLIARGSTRYVFEHRFDKKKVIKIDLSDHNGNVLEWDIWGRVKYVRAINKWFAPCHQISKCGRVLIMDRAVSLNGVEKLPAKIPAFFTDIKRDNFGYIGKQLVCVDYALNLLMEQGMTSKLKFVQW